MLFNPLQNHNPYMAMSLPIEFVNTIKYPIHVACECDYEIFVDGKFVDQANKEVNVLEYYYEGHPGWNATKFFFPVINTASPNIVAFHGIGGQFSGFENGFVMDMNNGADYTKYQEWKCKEFAVSALPANWYSYDYDDSLWEMSKSFGMNYQNNSFQIFGNERIGIHLQAEWLWTQDNSKTNVFCRKKDNRVQTIPELPTTAVPTTAVPTTAVPTTAVSTTAVPKIETTAVPKIETTAVSTTAVSTTAVPTTAVPTTAVPKVETTAVLHTSVSIATHNTPASTAAPKVETTAAPKVETTAAPKVETTAVPKVETTAVPKVETTAVLHTSVSIATHNTPASTAVPKVETTAVLHTSVSIATHNTPASTAVPKVETTAAPKVETTAAPKVETTAAPKVETTAAPKVETTAAPKVETTAVPTTAVPTTALPTTALPTTALPTTALPTTALPTTALPTTAVPKVETTAAPKVETTAAPKVETKAVPPKIETTAVPPKVETTAAPTSEIRNIYNIKIIINYAKVSRNTIDKHVDNLLHHLDLSRGNDNDNDKLYRELYGIVKKTHEHLHRHYNDILDYYQKILDDLYKQHNSNDEMERGRDSSDNDDDDDNIVDRYGRREKGERDEKGDKKEKLVDNKNRLTNSSKLIESMIKLNHYIKLIEYKIQFIKGETKYNLLQILYSLRKQYQDDMIQMLKYL
jgi:hypothetical protein